MPDRIDTIKERVAKARKLGDWPAWAYSLAFVDVPDLLAEVERLRGVVKTCADDGECPSCWQAIYESRVGTAAPDARPQPQEPLCACEACQRARKEAQDE